MNEAIAAAVISDINLSNNGYAGKINTAVNVARQTNTPVGVVHGTIKELADAGRIVCIGTFDRQTYYCTPENYGRVRSCLLEWAA